MKKIYFILLTSIFLINSCNVMELTGVVDGAVDKEFFGDSRLLNGLHNFWRFEENSGATRYDYKKMYPLTDTTTLGVPSVTGKYGRAINCGGAGTSGSKFLDNSSFSFSLTNTTSRNISFWYKRLGNMPTAGFYETVLWTADFRATIFQQTSTTLTDAQLTNAGNIYTFIDVLDFSDNDWHHISFNLINSTSSIELYIDGSYVTSQGYSPAAITGSALGFCSDSAGTQVSTGYIDSVGLWSRELLSDEIYNLANDNSPLD